MSAITVPTANVAALYVNTTGGTIADPAVMDAAILDIVNTVNSNANEQNLLVSEGVVSALGIINVKDYNASGDGDTTTTGSITTGLKALTVASTSTFAVGQGISVAGAGAAGATLVTTISSISSLVITLATAASTTVASAVVSHDDTVAIKAAIAACKLAGGGIVFFPEGTYILTKSIVIGELTYATAYAIYFEGTGTHTSIIKWLGTDGEGKTGTAFDWGNYVFGGFSKLRFITGAAEGHTSQTIDNYVTTTTGSAGCTSTSSIAIQHDYNGSFVIEKCDFYLFHKAIVMNMGYNRAIRDNSFMYCNVGIGTYSAATINFYVNNRVERCAIGLSFAQCSAHTIESTVSQANYAGLDVLIGSTTHSLHFNRCYFEASPRQVFILGGSATTVGDGMPSGHVFQECNSISIVSQGNIGDIYMVHGLCQTVPINHAGTGVASYYVIECYQHVGTPAVRTPATGFTLGANAVLYEQNSSKFGVKGNFGVGTNSPAGTTFGKYATVEGSNPAFSLKSTSTGGRRYSLGQPIFGGNGAFTIYDENASLYRLVIDSAGIVRAGSDNAQKLGATTARWSEVHAVEVNANLYKLTAITAASAPNNSMFVDSADNLLKFKDSAGTVKVVNLT